MEAITKEIDTTQESTTHSVQDVKDVTGISELTTVELAYVGGGTASMAFQ